MKPDREKKKKLIDKNGINQKQRIKEKLLYCKINIKSNDERIFIRVLYTCLNRCFRYVRSNEATEARVLYLVYI